jgi:hypothetical protein
MVVVGELIQDSGLAHVDVGVACTPAVQFIGVSVLDFSTLVSAFSFPWRVGLPDFGMCSLACVATAFSVPFCFACEVWLFRRVATTRENRLLPLVAARLVALASALTTLLAAAFVTGCADMV